MLVLTVGFGAIWIAADTTSRWTKPAGTGVLVFSDLTAEGVTATSGPLQVRRSGGALQFQVDTNGDITAEDIVASGTLKSTNTGANSFATSGTVRISASNGNQFTANSNGDVTAEDFAASGSIVATSNGTFGGTLDVTGNTRLDGTLGTTGSIVTASNGTVGGALDVTGAARFDSTVGTTGAVTAGGLLTASAGIKNGASGTTIKEWIVTSGTLTGGATSVTVAVSGASTVLTYAVAVDRTYCGAVGLVPLQALPELGTIDVAVSSATAVNRVFTLMVGKK